MSLKFSYDDKSLLVQIRKDNIKAFEILYNKYTAKLYFFIFGYVNSHADTEEIVQNSYLMVWEHRHHLDESCSLKNYLYTIAVNKVYNFLKHQAIQHNYKEYSIMHDTLLDDQTEKEILYNDLKKNINHLLQRLPEQQKNIFRMSRIEGFSNKEIASQLGLSVRTVENQIYRALQTIRLDLSNTYT
ncbi:MAG: RNA polymerase sigma-70 factor [Bacteroidales bacterium]|nr:RNA polymerase sigma-70 factor [Bacteroidales bacterium]